MRHYCLNRKIISSKGRVFSSAAIELTKILADDDTCGIVILDNSGNVIYANDLAYQYLATPRNISFEDFLSYLNIFLIQGNIQKLLKEGELRIVYSINKGEITEAKGNHWFRVVKMQDKSFELFMDEKKAGQVKTYGDIDNLNINKTKDINEENFIKGCFKEIVVYLNDKHIFKLKIIPDQVTGSGIIILKIIDIDKTDRYIQDFAGRVVHKLNNDMSDLNIVKEGIKRSYLEFQKKCAQQETCRNNITKFETEITDLEKRILKLQSTINNIKELAKKKEIILEKVDLKEKLNVLINSQKNKQKNIEFILKLPVKERLFIEADLSNLIEGFSRILENAIRAIEDRRSIEKKGSFKGKIIFQVAKKQILDTDMLEISIIDNGIGIPKNELVQIMLEHKSFVHRDLIKAKARVKGTGLGTNIAKTCLVTANTGQNLIFISEGYFTGMKVQIAFPVWQDKKGQ